MIFFGEHSGNIPGIVQLLLFMFQLNFKSSNFDSCHFRSWTVGTFFYQETSAKNGPILEWRGSAGIFGTHFWIWGGTIFTNLDPVTGASFYRHFQPPTLNTWRFIGASYNAETGALCMWDEDKVSRMVQIF
jgi:hypothetical protein